VGHGARYRVHQFAELAGVTVKTLHHYDRVGLLRPQRTHSGYRVYDCTGDRHPAKT
jgi:DNA-binding transcriptional MerR regulator